VSTLIKWFPDRRGLATGMAIMGFGGGAILGAPLKRHLMEHFYEAPRYLGAAEDVKLVTEQGKRFADVSGRPEVVVVGPGDVKHMLVPEREGVYVVGTGSVGVAQTFVALGALYFVIMLVAAFSYRLPAPGWTPAGWTPPSASGASQKMITSRNFTVEEAVRTPQFYLLWIVLCFNVTAGIGVLGVAQTMMTEIFGATLKEIVTPAFAATFVSMISVANMLGRFVWSSASDWLGRKRTYFLFFALGIVLYLAVPYIAQEQGRDPSVSWLVAFYVVTLLIFTMYGGGFATIPAYLSDLYGTKNVGAIHGRLLTAWSTAGVLGPVTITQLREATLLRALTQLAEQVDPARFEQAFGAARDQLPLLIEKKTVTLSRLMELAPQGTTDPSTTLYNSTMLVMAGLLGIALVANALVRPVDPGAARVE
jgi:nitrate/nitrite transporter NarK